MSADFHLPKSLKYCSGDGGNKALHLIDVVHSLNVRVLALCWRLNSGAIPHRHPELRFCIALIRVTGD